MANPPCNVVSCRRNSFITLEKLWPAKARWVSGEAAMDSASARAFWAAYFDTSEATAAVSSRTSSTGRENHLSSERFIRP